MALQTDTPKVYRSKWSPAEWVLWDAQQSMERMNMQPVQPDQNLIVAVIALPMLALPPLQQQQHQQQPSTSTPTPTPTPPPTSTSSTSQPIMTSLPASATSADPGSLGGGDTAADGTTGDDDEPAQKRARVE